MKQINETIKFLPHSIFEGTTPESKKRFEESANISSGWDNVVNDVLDRLNRKANRWGQPFKYKTDGKSLGTNDECWEWLLSLTLKIANLKEGYISPDINKLTDSLVDRNVIDGPFADWINSMIGGQEHCHGIKDDMVLDYEWYLDEICKSRLEITKLQKDLYEVTETKQNNEYLDSDFTFNIESFTDYLFDIENECNRSLEGLAEVDDKKANEFATISALKVAKENVRAIKDLIKALEAVGDSINKFDSVYG